MKCFERLVNDICSLISMTIDPRQLAYHPNGSTDDASIVLHTILTHLWQWQWELWKTTIPYLLHIYYNVTLSYCLYALHVTNKILKRGHNLHLGANLNP